MALSAPADIFLFDSDNAGLALGPVSFNGTMTLIADGSVTQSGPLTGNGDVTLAAASINPANAIPVDLNQAGNNVTGAGAFDLGNVGNLTLVNQGNLTLTGSIATTAVVNLTAGGVVLLPNGTAGTLTLGSLTVSAGQIQLGNGGVNLTADTIELTGAVVFNAGITLDASAASAFSVPIVLQGNVTDTAAGQPLTFNLPTDGTVDFTGGTWNQGSNNLTVNGTGARFLVAATATLVMSGNTLTFRGTPAAGGSPSANNLFDISGTLKVSGNVTVSDGGAGSVDSILDVNFFASSNLNVALGGASDSTLTLNGSNAADHITINSSVGLTGFGGAAASGPGTILAVLGGGSISGTFANPTDANGNFFIGSDIVTAQYTNPAAVTITPTPASASVPTGNEPDGDLYAVSTTGGTGLIVIQVNTANAQGLAMVVRNNSAAATLTVKTTTTSGNGFTSVLGIGIDGAGTATIAAPTSNLTGNIAVVGPLAALTLNNWTDGALTDGASTSVVTDITGNVFMAVSMTLATALGNLTANQVTGLGGGTFELGTLTAPSFGTITIKNAANSLGPPTPGNFFINLVNTNTVANPALKSATIGGTLTGTWNLAGPVGTVTAATTNKFTLGQAAGANIPNGGLLGNVASLSLGTATDVAIDSSGVVGSITAISLDNTITKGTLLAAAFGTITTTGTKGVDNGNFLANVTATGSAPRTELALGALQVAGNLGDTATPITLLFDNGDVGSIIAGATVESVTITAPTTPTGGAIAALGAGAWDQSNVTAASVGTWKIAANLPGLLLGRLHQKHRHAERRRGKQAADARYVLDHRRAAEEHVRHRRRQHHELHGWRRDDQ